MKTQAIIVPSDGVGLVWDHVRPFVENALSHSQGELDSDSVFSLLLEEKMILWIAVDEETDRIVGALVCEIINYPLISTLRLVTISGERGDDWLDHVDEIEAFGRVAGCSRIDAMCRPGFERAMFKYGYHKEYIHLGKSL